MNPKIRSQRILLVEDDDLIRVVAEETLRDAGYAVVSVPDGAEAWLALPNVLPNLIISDVRMPRCDGFELLQRVRSHPEFNQLPFIMLSAKTDIIDRRMGMSLGADDYVTKPYLPADLLKTIATRLERAAAIDQILYHQQRFLTSTLPHELRTPLTGIIGYADLIVQTTEAGQTLTPADLIDFGKKIKRSGYRMLRVAEDFSLWAWLEGQQEAMRAGQADGRTLQTIDRELIESVAAECAGEHGREGDLHFEIAAAQVEVAAEGLPRVLRHLIDNACKFSLPEAEIDVTARTNGHQLELTVADRGRGMTEAHIKHVGLMRQFGRERFEQQGIGMGLMIARGFARLSGGSLELEARQPGPGLTVRLLLPLAQPAPVLLERGQT